MSIHSGFILSVLVLHIGRLRLQHEQQSKLSCQNIVHYFTSRFSISEKHFSEECFNSFLLCLATTTRLRLSIGHLELQDITGNASSSHCLLSINETGCLFLLVLCYRLHFLLSTIIINILRIKRSGLMHFY